MRLLLWAECQKLRRSNIVLFTVFSAVLLAVFVLISGQTAADNGQAAIHAPGWYMTVTQVWSTLFAVPATIALLGSYLICREEQDDTMKTLRIIPVSETKLTAAKMTVTFIFSILIYLLLFVITCLTEAALHFSALSMEMVLKFLKMYLLDGIGVFAASSPIIVLIPYLKKSYWLALVLAEVYSFAGIFTSMSNVTKTFYPISAVFGVSGYYDTTPQGMIGSCVSLLLCACLTVILLSRQNRAAKKASGIDNF